MAILIRPMESADAERDPSPQNDGISEWFGCKIRPGRSLPDMDNVSLVSLQAPLGCWAIVKHGVSNAGKRTDQVQGHGQNCEH